MAKYRELLLRNIQKKQTSDYQTLIQDLQQQLDRKRLKKQHYKEQLNNILKEWEFNGKPLTNSEEFLNYFTPWISEQLETKENLNKLLTNHEAKDLKELENQLAASNQNHLNYLQELQERQEIEFKYKELEGERRNWLNPYLNKIRDLENQLLNLAKQKIKGQKEARELVKQIENNWQKDKEQHEQDLEKWNQVSAQKQETIANLEKDKKKQLEQIKTLTSDSDKLSKEKDRVILEKNKLQDDNLTLTNDKKILNKQLEDKDQEQQEQLRKINLFFNHD